MTQPTTVVFGGTGTQGAPVARALLDQGKQVRLITRTPDRAAKLQARGATVTAADLEDINALRRGLNGAQTVFVHLPLTFDADHGRRQADNVISALEHARPALVVFSTSGGYPTQLTDVTNFELKRATAERLLASDVPCIVLRPSIYLDNLVGAWVKPAIVANSTIAFPLRAELSATWVSVHDVARAAVAALNRPDLAGKVFNLGGASLTGDDLAKEVGIGIGRPLHYAPIPVPAFEKGLGDQFGPTIATLLAAQFHWFDENGSACIDTPTTTELADLVTTSATTWSKEQDWSLSDSSQWT